MIVEGDSHILFIEPSRLPAEEPVIDGVTRKMAAAFRKAIGIMATKGWHTCSCGAASSNVTHQLTDGQVTNSLCVHYLAYHRNEVSRDEIRKVLLLNCGEVEPTDEELHIPQGFRTRGL